MSDSCFPYVRNRNVQENIINWQKRQQLKIEQLFALVWVNIWFQMEKFSLSWNEEKELDREFLFKSVQLRRIFLTQ